MKYRKEIMCNALHTSHTRTRSPVLIAEICLIEQRGRVLFRHFCLFFCFWSLHELRYYVVIEEQKKNVSRFEMDHYIDNNRIIICDDALTFVHLNCFAVK